MSDKFLAIYDNIFSPEAISELGMFMSSVNFPWYLQPATTFNRKVDEKYKDIPWFSHKFVTDRVDSSPYANIPRLIVDTVANATGCKLGDIIRANGGATLQSFSDALTPPHHDDEINPHLVMIYYVNSSDGDTVLYHDNDDTKIAETITPVAGRVVVFNGSYLHSGSRPNKSNTRMIINFNLDIV